LQKQPTDRYRDYDELRQALTPFASAAPTPATLGLRYLAWVLDGLVLMPLILLLEFALVPDLNVLSELERNRPWLAAGLQFADMLLRVGYFGVLEGVWGFSLGKFICRLRVVGEDREPPGIPRAMLRAAIIVGIATLPVWLRFVFGLDSRGTVLFLTQLGMLGMLGMFATARRSNGYAAWHELVTGTHVISCEVRQTRTALATNESDLPEVPANALRIGPYHVLKVLTEGDGESWLLAYDPRLLRRVWIHRLPLGTPPVAARLRNLGRIGRLRWLTGWRSTSENWDAYEALSGQPLTNLLGSPQPWNQVRFWLLDLAEELAAAAKDGSLPEWLGLDRIWLTDEGRAKLLDFPAPGVAPLPGDQLLASQGAATVQFLNQVAQSALVGRVVPAKELSAAAPAVPLPIFARELLQSLPQCTSPESIVPVFAESTRKPAQVSRGKRIALLLGCCLPSVAIAVFGGLGAIMQRQWNEKHPQIRPLTNELMVLKLREIQYASDVDLAEKVAAEEQIIAYRFGDTIRDPAEWSSRYAESAIPSEYRRRAEAIAARYPEVTEPEYLAAVERVKVWHDRNDPGQLLRSSVQFMLVVGVPVLAGGFLIWVAIFSVLSAVIFRRGLLLRAFGLEIVTSQGVPASRLELFGRSLIVWSPLLLLPILAAFILPALQMIAPEGGIQLTVVALATLGSLYPILAFWSALMPERGIPDRLAGTWLVPR
jgi:hypothetical protein